MKCNKCKTDFEVRPEARTIFCPKCNTKYVFTGSSPDLLRVKQQLVRKIKKVKMNKKSRLKLRRGVE